VSRVLRLARHIIGHFVDESFQAITCTGTDTHKAKHAKQTEYSNLIYNKQTKENTKVTQCPRLLSKSKSKNSGDQTVLSAYQSNGNEPACCQAKKVAKK